MIVLGVVKRYRFSNLGRDAGKPRLGEFGLKRLQAGFCSVSLFEARRVNTGAILCSNIITLTHALGGIVVLPKGREQSLKR